MRRANPRLPIDELRANDPAAGPGKALALNLVSRRASLGDQELLLSPKEFNLLFEG